MEVQAAPFFMMWWLQIRSVLSQSSPGEKLDTEPEAERPLIVDAAINPHDLATGAITEALKKQIKRNTGSGSQRLGQSLKAYSSYESTGDACKVAALKRKESLAEETGRRARRKTAAVDDERRRHERAMNNLENELQSKLDELHRAERRTFAAEHQDEEDLRKSGQVLKRSARRRRDTESNTI